MWHSMSVARVVAVCTITGVAWFIDSHCVAQVTSANRSAIKAEFIELAPLMSMDTELELEKVDEKLVVKKLKLATELASKSLGSEPTLERVGNEHIKYLMLSEANIIPMLRATEPDLGALLVELASRAMEAQAVRTMQLGLDRQCRRSYEALMPLVKQLAGPVRQAKSEDVTCSYGQRSISVAPRVSLNNCTVAVTFAGVSKEECTAYLFAPTLSKTQALELRVPSDFALGPAGVVTLRVDIYADESSFEHLEFELTDNAKRIVQSTVRQLKDLVQKDPILALEQLDVLEKNPFSEPFADEIQSIRETASVVAKAQIGQLQELISARRKYLAQLKKPARMNATQRANRVRMIEANEAEVEKLAGRIKRLREIE